MWVQCYVRQNSSRSLHSPGQRSQMLFLGRAGAIPHASGSQPQVFRRPRGSLLTSLPTPLRLLHQYVGFLLVLRAAASMYHSSLSSTKMSAITCLPFCIYSYTVDSIYSRFQLLSVTASCVISKLACMNHHNATIHAEHTKRERCMCISTNSSSRFSCILMNVQFP